MALENRPLQELTMILSHGGGLDINVGNRPTEEICQLASFASPNARLILRGLTNRTCEELAQIASFGKGAVLFV